MKLVPYGAGWTDVYLNIGGDNLYFIISYALGNTFTDLLVILYYLHPDNNNPKFLKYLGIVWRVFLRDGLYLQRVQ